MASTTAQGENQVSYVAVQSLDDEEQPLYAKLTPVSDFTNKAIADRANTILLLVAQCFLMTWLVLTITGTGCQHQAIIAGSHKSKDVLELLWINTILGNLETSFGGAYYSFDFARYTSTMLRRSPILSTVASSPIHSYRG